MRSSCPLLQQLIVWLIKDEYRQVAAARGVERELERLERTLPGISGHARRCRGEAVVGGAEGCRLRCGGRYR
ncbi:hypothetical protein BHM03_00046259 [Ensete ventricosum]|nr:hypothetical protein BHM03_00046259 [Ensete ventricosum]